MNAPHMVSVAGEAQHSVHTAGSDSARVVSFVDGRRGRSVHGLAGLVAVVAVVGSLFLGWLVASSHLALLLFAAAGAAIVALTFRHPFAGLLLAVAAIPLEVAGRLAPGMEELTAAKVLLLLTAGAWLARLLLGKGRISTPRTGWALAGVWIVALTATALSPYGVSGTAVASLIAMLGQIALVFMAYDLIDSPRRLKLVLLAIVFSSAIVAAVGLLDVATQSSFLGTVTDQYYASSGSGLKRITATFYDPNALGRFLVFGILITMAALRLGRWSRSGRLAAFVLLGALGFSLLNTFSRGAMIAGAVGAAAMALLSSSLGASWIIGGALFVSAFSVVPDLTSAVLERLSLVEPGFGGRATAVSAAWEAFVRRPLIGYGPGNVPSAIGASLGAPLSAHNLFTEVLVGVGAIGALLFTLVVGSTFGRAMRIGSAELRPVARGLVAVMMGVLASGLSLHALKANELWLSLSLLLAVERLASMETPCGSLGTGQPEDVRRPDVTMGRSRRERVPVER